MKTTPRNIRTALLLAGISLTFSGLFAPVSLRAASTETETTEVAAETPAAEEKTPAAAETETTAAEEDTTAAEEDSKDEKESDKKKSTKKKTVKKKPVKKGWKKEKGKKRYYVKGAYVVGMKKIKKHYYLFDKKGFLTKNKSLKLKKVTYYADAHGYVEAYKKGGKWYLPSGKKMKKAAAMDFETLQTAKKIAGKITKKSWSKSKKLRACFNWVMKKYYRDRRTFSASRTAWPSVYANDHFKLGSGDCIADAAAFAYLAEAIGYKKVYVCTDSRARDAHGWAEIGGKVYDPLFYQAKGQKWRYWAASYKDYGFSTVVRVKLS